MGYQLRDIGGDRDATHTTLAMPRYGAVENGVRMDLNLAAAGVSFGAHLSDVSSAPVLDIKEGFISTLRVGNSNPSLEDATFSRSPSDVVEWLGRTGAVNAFKDYP